MGFKDLQTFNMGLLAKQGWIILNEESTLLQKVVKAKYFPNSSFLDSKIGFSPSYAWRGIWESKKELLQGCRWRVGNEKSINIWIDHWLPGYKVISQNMNDNNLQNKERVESLIDAITH